MSKTISKTFRLPPEIASEIEAGAQERKISQTQFIIGIVTENKFFKLRRDFEADLSRMGDDEDYKKEQKELSEADFL